MGKYEELEEFAQDIRIETLKALGKLGFGHIGGAMSVVELLAVLYGKVMNVAPKDPKKEDRDQLVMSKGHAGPALYATLALKGFFPMEMLDTINTGGTSLPSHCDRNKTPGVDMSTGSLGQGMSTAIGIALGQKMNRLSAYTYLVLGDGEAQEGQVWEGALFAPQHRVSNLIAFLDNNKKQLDGYTKDICDIGDAGRKFEDFGWKVLEADGHDVGAIAEAIAAAKAETENPTMIVLDTVKGKGCDFAENELYNHHMRFDGGQIEKALRALRQ